ncbi:hypothetical protein NIA69_04295 [Gemmiger formicilis]|nr:hypothetical protein [Gemmiger formicilis]
MQALDHISIDRIQTAEVVDGSWCPVNQTLIDDIRDNPGGTRRCLTTPPTCGCWTIWPPATGWTPRPTSPTTA